MTAHRFVGDRCARCQMMRSWPGASAPCSRHERSHEDALASLTAQQRHSLLRKVRARRRRGASIPELARRFDLPIRAVHALLEPAQEPPPRAA